MRQHGCTQELDYRHRRCDRGKKGRTIGAEQQYGTRTRRERRGAAVRNRDERSARSRNSVVGATPSRPAISRIEETTTESG
jgi:hypothetical protein